MLRLHGDQFTELGAVQLAVELGARSVDHLEATGEEGIAALAASEVVGVLLPASALFLDRPSRARGRRSTPAPPSHWRPISIRAAPSAKPAGGLLARLHQLKLSPTEALSACTVNAAHVLGRADHLGRVAPGFRADLVLLDAPDWRYLATTSPVT